MSKNETFFVRFLFLVWGWVPVNGEITVGLLVGIESNAKQTLLYQNRSVPCEPFGVIPLEKMVLTAPDRGKCTAAINQYYAEHPSERLFARRNLRLQQSYHYETIKEGCVLYGNGPESYSEMLLRNGLALIDPTFDNVEWNGRLKQALAGGERAQKGLHDTQIRASCINEEK